MSNKIMLYVSTRYTATAYTSDKYTPKEFEDKYLDYRTKLYVSFIYKGEQIALYYNRLITELNIPRTTWDEFISHMTDEIIVGHKVVLPAYIPGTDLPHSPVKAYDVDKVFHTELAYGDAKNKTKVENIHVHSEIVDICMDFSKVENKPDVVNSLVYVNGVCLRPIAYQDDDLVYAVDGRKYAYNEKNYPELLLIDYSSIGNLTKHNIIRQGEEAFRPIPGDTNFYLEEDKRTTSSNKRFLLSSAYNLREYTPIVVVAGVCIYPDQYTVINEHTLSIDCTNIPLHLSLARESQLLANYMHRAYHDTPYITPVTTLTEYLTRELTLDNDPLSSTLFVALLDKPKLYIHRSETSIWSPDKIQRSGYGNILLNKANGLIESYLSPAIETNESDQKRSYLKKALTTEFLVEDKHINAPFHVLGNTEMEPHLYEKNRTIAAYESMFIFGE